VPKSTGLTNGQKTEAVLALLRGEESVAKVARRYGISTATLLRYRDQFIEAGKIGLKDGKSAKPEQARIRELEQEIARRDQVIGEYTIANRILKKMQDGEL